MFGRNFEMQTREFLAIYINSSILLIIQYLAEQKWA